MLVIEASIEVMENKASVNKWSAYKKELVAKIAPRVLPTLHAGRDDDKDLIPMPLLHALRKQHVLDNNSNREDSGTQEED